MRTDHRPGPVKTNWGDKVGMRKLRSGKYQSGTRAGKYKFGARAGKYKFGAKAGDQAKGRGPGNTNTRQTTCV